MNNESAMTSQGHLHIMIYLALKTYAKHMQNVITGFTIDLKVI